MDAAVSNLNTACIDTEKVFGFMLGTAVMYRERDVDTDQVKATLCMGGVALCQLGFAPILVYPQGQ